MEKGRQILATLFVAYRCWIANATLILMISSSYGAWQRHDQQQDRSGQSRASTCWKVPEREFHRWIQCHRRWNRCHHQWNQCYHRPMSPNPSYPSPSCPNPNYPSPSCPRLLARVRLRQRPSLPHQSKLHISSVSKSISILSSKRLWIVKQHLCQFAEYRFFKGIE